MSKDNVVTVLFGLLAVGTVGIAAVDAFGPLRGCGVLAAVWLLMPYNK